MMKAVPMLGSAEKRSMPKLQGYDTAPACSALCALYMLQRHATDGRGIFALQHGLASEAFIVQVVYMPSIASLSLVSMRLLRDG